MTSILGSIRVLLILLVVLVNGCIAHQHRPVPDETAPSDQVNLSWINLVPISLMEYLASVQSENLKPTTDPHSMPPKLSAWTIPLYSAPSTASIRLGVVEFYLIADDPTGRMFSARFRDFMNNTSGVFKADAGSMRDRGAELLVTIQERKAGWIEIPAGPLSAAAWLQIEEDSRRISTSLLPSVVEEVSGGIPYYFKHGIVNFGGFEEGKVRLQKFTEDPCCSPDIVSAARGEVLRLPVSGLFNEDHHLVLDFACPRGC